MRPLNGLFTTESYPQLIIGLNEPDDSAVYKLDDERALIATTDFFPPVVDDPYDFGAIAAANALSDVYAMGGEPLMAINLVGWPDDLELEILSEILRGGAETVRDAGAVIAGGHTVKDSEPKYGLAVTGQVHPDRIVTKGGALPGDQLILTKPLGSGIVTTALKRGKADDAHVRAAVDNMRRLNRDAARAAVSIGVHAMTDITGYSLLGHAHEMAHLSAADFVIDYDSLAWLPGVSEYASRAIFPGGTAANAEYFEQWVTLPAFFSTLERGMLYDPQTSGGLLIAVAADKVGGLLQKIQANDTDARIIGEVSSGSGRIMVSKG